MDRGYVKFYRKSVDNALFKKPLVWHFWQYCLLRANYKDREIEFNGKPLFLKKGSFVMSLKSASRDTGLSVQNIRSAIKSLYSFSMIEKSTQELTKQATIISICNYEFYQSEKNEHNTDTNKVPTKCQQSANKVPTLDKNIKHFKKVKNNKFFVEDSNEFRLAKFLLNHIRKHKPDFKQPNLQTWAKDADLMLRVDGRELDKAQKIIAWCQTDSFWQSNVLSMQAVRRQFDALEIRMREKSINGNQPRREKTERQKQSDADFLAVLEEDEQRQQERL